MGCANSKEDDSPAVALCRERCASLEEAVRLRYTFSEAHAAYLQSLRTVGMSLDSFFNQDLEGSVDRHQQSVLNLPSQRKGDPPSGSSSEKIHHLHSHSNSGSHLNFHSDSDDDDASADSLHHHEAGSPLHHLPYDGYMPDYGNGNFPGVAGGGAGRYMNINYMKNQATPSLVYTQRPMNPETMHIGESSASSSSYTPGFFSSSGNDSSFPYSDYNYNGYQNFPNYGAGTGFSVGSSVPYGGGFSSADASNNKAPPPPSPPRSSGWDYLNPFETFEKFYPAITPSRDFREVKEAEGIPDLEDEDDDEIVKEVHIDKKFVGNGKNSHSKPSVSNEDVRVTKDSQKQQGSRPSFGMESHPIEYEVHVVADKVIDGEDTSKGQANVSGMKPRVVLKGDLEVVKEIKIQFERASESGAEFSKFLEVGKLPYKSKNVVHHVSSKILHLPLISSQPSSVNGSEVDSTDPAYLDADQDVDMKSTTLSSTLHKLYLWEKKLYEEVKVEEKSRLLHERKSKKLKLLDTKGAEAHKIDSIRTLVRDLSTKIRIAIQVVDKISVKINCLRDEELWPQLNEFIKGLARMWKHMLECHHNQVRAITEAKRLDAIAFRQHHSDAHSEATRQLEHDLINWTLKFSYWVGAQKSYIRSLNDWLMKCLLYVPEETADGTVPFSPSRIGAPAVFIVCNQWWQLIERISEKEVIDSMRELASNVLQLWDRDKAEIRQRMLANKDERKIKILDREDQKIQKQISAFDKRMVLLNPVDYNVMRSRGLAVFQSETTKGGSLQASLQHVLEAMERFAASSLKVYEELLQRIDQDNLAREHERVS